MWLTYLEASRRYRSGNLTWDEYVDQLLSRAAGGGNIKDEVQGGITELVDEDPFAHSMSLWTGQYLLKSQADLVRSSRLHSAS